MGLYYGCAFHGLEDVFNTEAYWTVNTVNAKDFQNHFEIHYTNDNTGKILYSYFRILNPIALRGPTEIKCSVGSSYVRFQMNSEIFLN